MRTTTRESLNMTTVVFMVAFAQNPLSNGASTVPNLATDNNNLLDYHSFTVLSANDLKKATEELLKRNGTNSAQPLRNESLSTSNTSMEEFPDAEKNPYALIFAVIPVLTIFGNGNFKLRKSINPLRKKNYLFKHLLSSPYFWIEVFKQ